MSDKSKPSHIERTVYVAPTVKPGDSVRYGDWFDDESQVMRTWYDDAHEAPGNSLGRYTARGIPMTLISYATGSDYSGCLVEVSNARALKRDFPWLVEVHGGHGTFGVAYLGKRENQSDALIEAIDALTQYPLYDEQDHSDLECEREYDAWSEAYGGRHDFKRALVAYFDETYAPDEHDLDDDSFNERIDALWYACTERLNGGESHLNEQGDSIYFPIDGIMKKIRASWPGMSKAGYDGSPSLDWMLVRLAEDCTVAEGVTTKA